ncbi:MAG: hypothetical protein ACFFBD_19065 [Candidatus Hodarchaeota archaeon]
MVVYEVGIIVSGGLPVLTRSYNQDEVGGNALLLSSFFSAIQTFIEGVFADKSEELTMKKYTIHLRELSWGEYAGDSFVYVICSRDTKSNIIKRALDRLIVEIAKFENPTDSNDAASYERLIPVVDRIFTKLGQSTDERLKGVFG